MVRIVDSYTEESQSSLYGIEWPNILKITSGQLQLGSYFCSFDRHVSELLQWAGQEVSDQTRAEMSC